MCVFARIKRELYLIQFSFSSPFLFYSRLTAHEIRSFIFDFIPWFKKILQDVNTSHSHNTDKSHLSCPVSSDQAVSAIAQ